MIEPARAATYNSTWWPFLVVILRAGIRGNGTACEARFALRHVANMTATASVFEFHGSNLRHVAVTAAIPNYRMRDASLA